MKTILRSLATANPPRYVTQEEAYEVYCSQFDLEPGERDLYRRLLLEGPIRGRTVAVATDTEAAETHPDRLNERFLKFGRLIACEAAREALAGAELRAADIGALVVNTCTGYLCPGLSSYVAEDLGLDASVKPLDLMGMGCGAAIPNFEAAAGLLARGLEKAVLSIAVEICTATLFMGPEPDLVVSNSIFGDGAAAAVVDAVPDDAPDGLARLRDFASGLFPQHREELRYRSEEGRLRNVLGRRVPVIGARASAEVARRLLARSGLSTEQVRWWAVHPGGTAVLDRLAEELGLADGALRFSYDVFRDYGNMSSPSVLFVLRRILDEGRPQPGELGVLLAFGAGFSAFAALVEF